MTIETGQNKAVVGFRGSESINKFQKVTDWTIADFGLLDSTITGQQKDATEYMRYLYANYPGYEYTTAGHSLGGNLAQHALLTAPDGMIVAHGYSYDGPGNSAEYNTLYADQINKNGWKLTHYQWSLIGGLLYPLPDDTGKYIYVKTGNYDNQYCSGLARMAGN